ncbi:hypothetical protein BVER_02348c [Candidatus Burkholderia verschuerenii]|uniref:DUF2285 domain-containing protein n=1 Tax=Candidatus Burkholderia verschuerenii TaxID=242163 RepID=A0A0L0M5N1_9BURK|nr:DUF2285 domain-containing protein [Candidatus Burkholderia verschuerenii]KND57580.1 hypothetical protein BVER_02348c [Candidatus Burkholderia verschuerenii]
MTGRRIAAWYPSAAYLYILHLDAPGLAWEYLRRHPDYRDDWRNRRHRPDAAHRWGLRLFEDPIRDARDAHPMWFPDPDAVLQLYPDADPPPGAEAFAFWRLPGHKQLVHDGKRLVLTATWPGCCVRLALAPDLAEGMAYLYAIRACASPCTRYQTLATELDKLAGVDGLAPAAVARSQPTATALLDMHTVQALDATLAGFPARAIAEGLFGTETFEAHWHSDSGLRSRVRRLIRRGRALMRGGYRGLIYPDR